jgi:CheY-like chemotaxis protein
MGRGGFYAMESLSGIYALLVESDPERRTLLSGVLRYCGALVTPVETHADALVVMDLLKPDVLVVDFSRADDALAFIRRVRSFKPEDGGTIAAVALGEAGAQADLARSRGFDAFVATPVDPWELCRVIAGLLDA